MMMSFDPIADILLGSLLVIASRKSSVFKQTVENEPVTQPASVAYSSTVPTGAVEIVRILPGGTYRKTGMIRPQGHPDIQEALGHAELAILRSDGNVEVTPGEIEVSPNVS